ncbi:MAG: hypothetical protein AAF944_07775 [Bacteroidota bacterium]
MKIKPSTLLDQPVFLVISTMILIGSAAFSQSSSQTSGKEYRSNSVRLWIPDEVKLVRGVFWIINRGDTEALYYDNGVRESDPSLPEDVEEFGSRAVMKELGLAMAYDSTDVGEGTDILAELASFAELSGHPELAYTGIIPTGISGGGWASSQLLLDLSDRVITTFPSHGGLANISDATKTIPRLDFTAAEDNFSERISTSKIMEGRAMNAPWAEIIMPTGVHPWWQWAEFQVMASWLRSVLPMRLPDEVPTDQPIQLTPVSVNSNHWLGRLEYQNIGDYSIENVTVSPYSEYPINRTEAHWLPDEEFAKTWVKFMTQPAKFTSFAAPSTVTPGSTQTIRMGYVANTECDVVVYFASPSMVQADGWPITEYGEARTQVNAGSGEVSLEIKIDDAVPLKQDGYHFRAFIAPPGGTKDDRFDGTFKRAVDCVSSAGN